MSDKKDRREGWVRPEAISDHHGQGTRVKMREVLLSDLIEVNSHPATERIAELEFQLAEFRSAARKGICVVGCTCGSKGLCGLCRVHEILHAALTESEASDE